MKLKSVITAIWVLGTVHVDARMVLGANVNEHGIALEPAMLELSRTKVVRIFFPASPFILGKRNLKTDKDFLAVKAAAKSGRQVILCLKWDFKKAGWRVPASGSGLEQKCFAWADALLHELDGMVLALETVNEVMVDTPAEDLQPGADGKIPMVQFLQRLVEHLKEKKHRDLNRRPLPIFSGGFTRFDRPKMRRHPCVAELLKWIRTDSRVAGASLHIHMLQFEGFENSLRFIRSKIPKKHLLVTEFSMVWKYRANLNKPVSGNLTVREYINRALKHPVSEAEWNNFLESQAWYDTDFLSHACRVMEKYDVRVATFAFQQGSSGGRPLKPDSTPWILNPIFSNRTARSAHGPARSAFFNDYIAWQTR